jgi:hypothetical protein
LEGSKQTARAENAMRQKWRTDKFRNDKTVWMILISNDLLQLHRSVGDLCVDAAMYLRKSETHFVRCGLLGK